MKQPVLPVGDKLLVLPIAKEWIEVNGIQVEECDLAKGIAVSVSDQLKTVIQPGDTVFFPDKKATTHVVDGKPHLWLTISDIWGIEVDEKNIKDKGDSL